MDLLSFNPFNLTRILLFGIPYLPIIILNLWFPPLHLQSILDVHGPLEIWTLCHPTVPWLTTEIKGMIKRSEAGQHKIFLTCLPDDYAYFKELQNATQSAAWHAKSLYFHNALFNAYYSKFKWKIIPTRVK